MTQPTDLENQKIAQQGYASYDVGDSVAIRVNGKREQVGYVIEKIDDASGQQAYIIADQKLPANPSKDQLDSVKNVSVIYRGSSTDASLDAVNDWLVNDIPMAEQIGGNAINKLLPPNKKLTIPNVGTPQLVTSANTLHKAMDKYPNALFAVYGHSLGSMDGQYAIADLSAKEQKRLISAYLYEGPNIYSVLTDGQKKNVAALNKLNKAFNYIDTNDIVTMKSYRNNGSNAVGNTVFINSKWTANVGKQHMWGGYQYNENGSIIVKSDYVAKLAEETTKNDMNIIADLKKRMTANGGGLSSGEKILLDQLEARSIAKGMLLIVESKFGDLTLEYKNAITKTNQLWQDTKAQASIIGQHLSAGEETTALANGGATENNIKTQPIKDYQDSIMQVKSLVEEYTAIVKNINTTIDAQVQTDTDLANEIAGLLA
ncbi:hypothetical protein ESZ50_11050 [Weissella muntiaci]|uniref:Uncharacterized protein n=1 Tax=Weissella muntiaci TaxID=2508881 RepID=A0A6C2C1R1_9LACO|nr:hypothetical protein [Weissella muntiaci]TYC47884.1 hypothetical protein ESZ50_11050 [Weissella muntiaci]